MKQNIFTLKKIRFSTLFLCLIGTFTFAQSTSLVVVDSEYSQKEKVIPLVSTSKILNLKTGSNPWKAIRESIEADKSITTIHLFTEANYNSLRMGGLSYDMDAVNDEFELSMLEGLYQGTHLQLLVYNCNLGSNEDGIELLTQIGQRTYMNVGASTNCTSIFDTDLIFDFKTRDEALTSPIIQN